MSFIIAIVIGGISGWLAGQIMNTQFSLFGNIGIGIVGGFVGSLLLSALSSRL